MIGRIMATQISNGHKKWYNVEDGVRVRSSLAKHPPHQRLYLVGALFWSILKNAFLFNYPCHSAPNALALARSSHTPPNDLVRCVPHRARSTEN